ncbi:MAG TPA: TraR/DksA family transcriptional regulator [Mycobacteriales bacterium]|nr:TraR/DksA family transcriptional regulator [Mycobacteriales bacterium]
MSDAARRLAERRLELAAQITTMERDFAEVVQASADSNADDEHDPEGATIAFERQQLAALIESTRAHVAEVDRAIADLAAGGYGRCERCGASIGEERLVARPSARTCIACAGSGDSPGGRNAGGPSGVTSPA